MHFSSAGKPCPLGRVGGQLTPVSLSCRITLLEFFLCVLKKLYLFIIVRVKISCFYLYFLKYKTACSPEQKVESSGQNSYPFGLYSSNDLARCFHCSAGLPRPRRLNWTLNWPGESLGGSLAFRGFYCVLSASPTWINYFLI